MIHVTGKARLAESSFAEKTLCRASAFALEFGPKFRMAFSETVDRPARVDHTVGVRKNVHNAQVAAQKARCGKRLGFGNFDDLVNEETATTIDQSGFVFAGQTHARAGDEGMVMSIEKHRAIPLVAMFIDGDSTQRPKGGRCRALDFVPVTRSYLADSDDGLRACQTKFRPEPMVRSALKGEPMEEVFLEGDLRQGIAAFIELLHHRTKNCGIVLYLHYGCDSHAISIPLSTTSGQSPC